ncbi:hypothetical protein ACFXPX_01830 [Kitasatospora sp. NPDC059146]|uniref:hypothetical protein n=1 Tax=unclassified Kitasatospora TaxID=2633591 RepID=UPI0035DBF59D
MSSSAFRTGMPDLITGAATPIRRTRIPGKGKTMKMIKAIVKKFKRDEDLANHAWVLHVI